MLLISLYQQSQERLNINNDILVFALIYRFWFKTASIIAEQQCSVDVGNEIVQLILLYLDYKAVTWLIEYI